MAHAQRLRLLSENQLHSQEPTAKMGKKTIQSSGKQSRTFLQWSGAAQGWMVPKDTDVINLPRARRRLSVCQTEEKARHPSLVCTKLNLKCVDDCVNFTLRLTVLRATIKCCLGDTQAVGLCQRSRLHNFTSMYGPAVQSVHGPKARWPITARRQVGFRRSQTDWSG